MTAWIKPRFEVWSNHNQQPSPELVDTLDTQQEADARVAQINELPPGPVPPASPPQIVENGSPVTDPNS